MTLFDLHEAWRQIEMLDPESQEYRDVCAHLDNMKDDELRYIADQNIRFVSRLALNRCVRRGLMDTKIKTAFS